ncbi:MAG: DUF2207 domain-containing protein [Patescibacteria group bacterium]
MGRFNVTFLAVVGQVTLLLALLAPGVSIAATPVESLVINASINSEGIILIEQKITYVTPSQLDWAVFSEVKNLTARSSQNSQPTKVSVKKSSGQTTIASQDFSTDWIISYQAPGNLIRHNNRDQFFLKVIDKPDRPIYQTQIIFSLPDGINSKTQLSGNVYSLSGVNEPKTTVINNQQIEFSADYAGPVSLLTISANWDKGIIILTPIKQAKLALSQLDAAPWLAFGILLPIASLFALISLLWRQKRQEQSSDKLLEKPPSALSPALVGVLVRKKIYPEEIAALLIDLCQRGYLIIVKRADSYYLAMRKTLDEQVEPWEKEIVEEMFAGNQHFSDQQLQNIGSTKLYSPQVRDAFRRVYDVITRQSYFQENPHQTRVRNKLVALAIYYASATAMIWIAVTDSSPYLILPLAGTMLVATLIIKTATRLANYSQRGLIERGRWQEFGNFLKANKPLPFESARNHTFEKYLPYAVALNSTLQWARRFDLSSISLIKPDWFVTYEESSTVEIAKDVAKFTNQISEGISSLRGPLVS